MLLGGSSILVLVLVGTILFWTFQASSDEREIQELLATRARALDQKDLPLYLACFSPDYRSGTRTYADLQADASQWFAQFATIHFAFQTVNIQFQGDQAIVENTYKFSVTDTTGEPLRIAKRELLEIRHEHTGWKITRALAIQ